MLIILYCKNHNWFWVLLHVCYSYLWTYDLYSTIRNAFAAGNIHYEGKSDRVEPGNRDFFGPCEMASSRWVSAIWGPKSRDLYPSVHNMTSAIELYSNCMYPNSISFLERHIGIVKKLYEHFFKWKEKCRYEYVVEMYNSPICNKTVSIYLGFRRSWKKWPNIISAKCSFEDTLSMYNIWKNMKKFKYLEYRFKGTQAWNFFITFFAETETIWSQGPVTRDF
jgi:hypothetical protein